MASQPTQDLSAYKVYSEDKELPGTFNILSIVVERSINRVPVARIIMRDGDPAAQTFKNSDSAELEPGKKIKIEAEGTDLIEEIKLYIREYKLKKSQLKGKIYSHQELFEHDIKEEPKQEIYLLAQIIDIERKVLIDLWRKDRSVGQEIAS